MRLATAVALGLGILFLPLKGSAATFNVQTGEFFFSPANDTIHVHDMVQWTNAGTVTHTSTSLPASTEIWDSGALGPGGMFSHTFDQPGTFPYQCTIHTTLMQGTIVVLNVTSVKSSTWGSLRRHYRTKPVRTGGAQAVRVRHGVSPRSASLAKVIR